MLCLWLCLLSVKLTGVSAVHVDIAGMRLELESACARGECRKHSNTSDGIKNTTECHGRLTAYEFGLSLIPLRSPQIESFDALELESCGITRPADTPLPPVKLNVSSDGTTVFVDAAKGSAERAHEAAKQLQEQVAALEADKAALVSEKAALVAEVAQHAGHLNHKQKIAYVAKLKQENEDLRAALKKAQLAAYAKEGGAAGSNKENRKARAAVA